VADAVVEVCTRGRRPVSQEQDRITCYTRTWSWRIE
jgi:hypothetical protein